MAWISKSMEIDGRYRWFKINVRWSYVEGSANIATNTSKVKIEGCLYQQDRNAFDYSGSGWPCKFQLQWNGSDVGSVQNFYKLDAGNGVFGAGYYASISLTIDVKHNDSGDATGFASLKYTKGGDNNNAPHSQTISTESASLPHIDRMSNIKSLISSNSKLDGIVTLTIDRKNTAFNHQVWYRFGGESYSWAEISGRVETSCSVPISKSLANRIPNSTSGILEVCVRTYNGQTQIGTDVYENITLSISDDMVPSMTAPTFSGVSDIVPASWNNTIVKGYSKIKIHINGATGSYGSTIKSYSISGPDITANGLTVPYATANTFAAYSSNKYVCTVIDSRGKSASKEITVTAYDYSVPSVDLKAYRCDSTSKADMDGTKLMVTATFSFKAVNGHNSIVSKSVICNDETITSATSFSSGVAFFMNTNCLINKKYILKLSVKDELGSISTNNLEISDSWRIMNISPDKHGIAFGGFSKIKNAFECNMDPYVHGFSLTEYVLNQLKFHIWVSRSAYSPTNCQNYCERTTPVDWPGYSVDRYSPYKANKIILLLLKSTDGATYISLQKTLGTEEHSQLQPLNIYWILPK